MHELTLHTTHQPKRTLILSLRCFVYFAVWLCMWQGASFSGSAFQLEFIALYPGMPLCEAALFLAGLAVILERWITKDYSLKRSYFGAPMLALFILLVFSWMRGQFVMQSFRAVYEIHEAILIPVAYLIYVNAFRDVRERKILAWIFITAAIMKAADAAWIRFFADASEARWGALLMWRDGYILALGMAGALILAHYHGNMFKRLRTVAIVSVPFLAYGLLVSYRRTFIIAIILCCVTMIVSLGRGRRLKHVRNFFFVLLIISISVLFTDPLGMIARMAGTFMPSEEGSSYIRLIEYPNILRNISDSPVFGLPVGIKWHMYYYMPLFANATALGAHNTYLYWALRTGIIGFAAFLWLLARIWKVVLINWRLQRTEEDFFYNHFLLYAFGLYNFGCFFGLMYSDAMGIMTGLLLIFLQLQMVKMTGLESLKHVDFLKTMSRKQIVMRPKITFTPEAAKLAKELRLASQTKS